MEKVIVTGFSNATHEGVVLHTNIKAKLKTGNISANEFWVSWDKIGNELFDNYTDATQVSDRKEIRGE